MLMVIGCGRSGTKFTSTLFKKNGIDIGHESLGEDGIASWCLVPDTYLSIYGPSFLKLKRYRMPVVHQVRHPLKVIASMQTANKYSWQFISNFIKIGRFDSTIKKCMKYWYYWNLLSEKKAQYRYKVEEIQQSFTKLCEIGDFSLDAECKYDVSKSTNTREHSELTVNDLYLRAPLLTRKIIRMARRYGYNI